MRAGVQDSSCRHLLLKRPPRITGRVETVSGSDALAGDEVLNRITEAGIDLLDMSAYGHTRIRELRLGDVTRQVMRNIAVPVLLSH